MMTVRSLRRYQVHSMMYVRICIYMCIARSIMYARRFSSRSSYRRYHFGRKYRERLPINVNTKRYLCFRQERYMVVIFVRTTVECFDIKVFPSVTPFSPCTASTHIVRCTPVLCDTYDCTVLLYSQHCCMMCMIIVCVSYSLVPL